MKVLFLMPHLKIVGGVRRVLEVTNRLMALGHDISIATPTGERCKWLISKVPVYKISKIYKHSFDIVLFNLAEQYRIALDIKAKKRVFWVLAAEGWYKDPVIPTQALQQDFYFLANSKYTVKYIHTHRKVKYDIPIIPGGINPDHFKYDPDMPKDYHVLYYGSKRPWKGTHIIEEALLVSPFKLLKMEGMNTPQEKMYTLYNRSTVFVSACQSEGFGFPILEAMACGCTVICTDDGGNRDFVQHNVNAITIPRNAVSINHAVRDVLSRKDLRRRLRIAGLKTARDPKYDWDNVTTRVEQSFLTLLKQ